MAIYHLSFKLCKRSEGKSSVYLAAYQNRNKFTDNRTGAVWNYSKKEGFDGSLILAPTTEERTDCQVLRCRLAGGAGRQTKKRPFNKILSG